MKTKKELIEKALESLSDNEIGDIYLSPCPYERYDEESNTYFCTCAYPCIDNQGCNVN